MDRSRITRVVVRGVAAGVLAAGVLAVVPAGADFDDDGPGCEGTATFVEGTDAEGSFTVVASDLGDETIVVPRADTVEWTGSVRAAPGDFDGFVAIDLPWPAGTVEAATWSGDGDTTSNSGVDEYDLPWVVPAGVEFTVRAAHTDDNGTCTASVTVEIEGGPFDTPIAPVSLGATVLTGAGFLGLLRPLFRRAL